MPTPEENQQALVEVMELARQAITAETPKCVNCGNAIFFYEWHEALTKGHVYSAAGRREIRLSGYCEFCFDELADELEGDSDDRNPS